MKKSWKTSALAIGAIICAAYTMIGVPLLDNDPATIPHFQDFITMALAAGVGLFSRDHDVSSEDAGIK